MSAFRKRTTIFIAPLVCIIIFLFWPGPRLYQLFTLPSTSIENLFEFRAHDKLTNPALEQLQVEGFVKRQSGFLILDSEKNGFVALPFLADKPGLTTLHLSAGAEAGVQLGVALVDDTVKHTKVLLAPWDFHYQDLNLTPHLQPGHPYRIEIFSDSIKGQGRYFVVEEIVLRRAPAIPAWPRLDFFVFGMCALVLIGCFIAIHDKAISVIQWVPLIFILVLAFSWRWKMLGASFGQALQGDATSYFDWARSFQFANPFAFGIREPGYIWLQVAWAHVVGWGQIQFRLLSVLASIGIIAATYVLSKAITGRHDAAFGAATALGVSRFLIWNAPRGERSEVFALMLLVYLIFLIKYHHPTFKQAVPLGILAGMVSLVWLIGLVSASLAYAALKIRAKKDFLGFAVFIGSALLIVGPHLAYEWRTTGDPLHAVNVHTNFYKNVRESGVPSQNGPRGNMGRYVLDQGPKLIWQTAKGYFDLLINPQNEINKMMCGYSDYRRFLFYPVLLLGLIVAARRGYSAIFLIFFATLNVSVAFLNNVFDPRLFLHATPFAAFFIGVGFSQIIDAARPLGRRVLNLSQQLRAAFH